jgi:Helicase C-terminal domain
VSNSQQGAGLDFGKLLAARSTTAPIEPSVLYEGLPNKAPNYGYLRLVQGQVLEQWHHRRDTRDLVIKVNTGGGKTIDGLVILQSLLNEGKGPALYVAPDPYLVTQVEKEAARLGLVTVTDPDNPLYLRSQAICVINAHKLVNGKTVFSTSRSPRTPAPIGAVVIDDAHAAISTTRAQLSLSVPASNPAFQALLNLFATDLESYSPNAFLDVTERIYGALARIPFWVWRAKLTSVRRILRQHAHSPELEFAWPAVSDALEYCRAVFSGSEVTITPPCPPIQHVSNFLTAHHRIYLTATLADDGVLVTDFDADPQSVANPITPKTAGDIGERMILAPQEINSSIEASEIRNAMKKLSKDHNVVVLVPSYRAAEAWKDVANQIVGSKAAEMEPVVRQLLDAKKSPQLVVFVNVYDGIDLPGEACRVLVLDGLPEAFGPEERLESQLTSRTTGTDDRQIQRIEQGMGRGVRSNEDHCVVILMGPRLSQLVAHPATVSRFSPATQAQLELSSDVAKNLANMPLAKVLQVADQALTRDSNWVLLAKDALNGLVPTPGHVSGAAIARRRAFDSAMSGNLPAATSLLQEAIDHAPDVREQGWLLEQLASYTDHTDPGRAQQQLADARALNADVLRPVVVSAYTPLKSSEMQGERASKVLSDRFSSATDLVLGFEAVVSDLIFDDTRTEEFEAAMLDVGRLIGLNAGRPEKELLDGPDDLWALDQDRYWVIEAKTGAKTNFIAKKDVNQLAGSINWFGEHYINGETATPVMVHSARTLGPGASAVPGMRILAPRKLGEFIANVRSFASALSTAGWADHSKVAELLHSYELSIDQLDDYLVSFSASKS